MDAARNTTLTGFALLSRPTTTAPAALQPNTSAALADAYIAGSTGQPAIYGRNWSTAAPVGRPVVFTAACNGAALQPAAPALQMQSAVEVPGQAPWRDLVDRQDAATRQSEQLRQAADRAGLDAEAAERELRLRGLSDEKMASVKAYQALYKQAPNGLSYDQRRQFKELEAKLGDRKVLDIARRQVDAQQQQTTLRGRSDQAQRQGKALETRVQGLGGATGSAVQEYRRQRDQHSANPADDRLEAARRQLEGNLALAQSEQKQTRAGALEAEARRLNESIARGADPDQLAREKAEAGKLQAEATKLRSESTALEASLPPAHLQEYKAAQADVQKREEDAGRRPRQVELPADMEKKLKDGDFLGLYAPLTDKQHPELAGKLADALAQRVQDGNFEARKRLQQAADRGNERARQLIANLPPNSTDELLAGGAGEWIAQDGGVGLNRTLKAHPERGKSIYQQLGNDLAGQPADSPEAKKVQAWLEERGKTDKKARTEMDRGLFQRGLHEPEVYRTQQGKADLLRGLQSPDAELRAQSAAQLAALAAQGKTDLLQTLAQANTPESWDALAGLAGRGVDATDQLGQTVGNPARDLLRKGGAPALAAIAQRWDAADPANRKGLARSMGGLDNPALAQGLKNGSPAQLARVVGESLREDWNIGSSDARFKGLQQANTEASRTALLGLVNTNNGQLAVDALGATADGRAAALAALDRLPADQKVKLLPAALHPAQVAAQPEAQKKLRELAASTDPAVRKAALEAARKLPYDFQPDAATLKALLDGSVAALKTGEVLPAKEVLERAIGKGLSDEQAASLRAQLKAAGPGKEVAALSRSVDERNFGEGDRLVADALEKGDLKTLGEKIGTLTDKGYIVLKGQLEQKGQTVPQFLEQLRKDHPQDYTRVLDGMLAGSSKVGRQELAEELKRRSQDPQDATLRLFAERNGKKEADVLHLLGDIGTPGAMTSLEGLTTKARTENRSLLELHNVLAGQLNSADPAIQKRAAEALLNAQPGTAEGPALQSLVDYAVASGDESLKARALAQVPEPPLNGERIKNVPEAFQKRLQEAIKGAPEGSDLANLGKLYQALSLKDDPKYGKHVDVDKVKAKINELFTGPLAGRMKNLMEGAKGDVLGYNCEQNQINYMTGDALQQRLRLLPPEKAKELAKAESVKLAAVASPEKTQAAMADFTRKYLESQGPELLAKVPADKKNDAVQQSLMNTLQAAHDNATDPNEKKEFKEALDAIKDRAGNARTAADLLIKTAEGKALKRASRFTDEITKLAEHALPEEKKAMGAIGKALDRLHVNGSIKGVMAGAGLLGIAMGGAGLMAGGGINSMSDVATVVSGLGNIEDVAHVAKWISGAKYGVKMPTLVAGLSSLGRVASVLGPVGDGLSAGIDMADAIEKYQKGDTHGAIGKGAMALGEAGLCVTGALFLAGVSTGPVGWVCLGVVGAGMLYNWMFGESDEENLLKHGVQVGGKDFNVWK